MSYISNKNTSFVYNSIKTVTSATINRVFSGNNLMQLSWNVKQHRAMTWWC